MILQRGDNAVPCFNCGHPAAALWRGHTPVAVCRPCALDTLPRLLADALVGTHPRRPSLIAELGNGLETARANFWRAAACAQAAEAQRDRDAQPAAGSTGRPSRN